MARADVADGKDLQIWIVAAKRTADKGWTFLGGVRWPTTHREKIRVLRNVAQCLGLDIKTCLSRYGKNTDWGCLRTVCWGAYMDPGGMKWQEGEESCIKSRRISWEMEGWRSHCWNTLYTSGKGCHHRTISSATVTTWCGVRMPLKCQRTPNGSLLHLGSLKFTIPHSRQCENRLRLFDGHFSSEFTFILFSGPSNHASDAPSHISH
jgi:hypothetical protein